MSVFSASVKAMPNLLWRRLRAKPPGPTWPRRYPSLADVLQHHRALVSGVAGGRDGGRVGRRVRRRAEATDPVPGLGDDLLQAVDRLPRDHRDAVDDRDDAIFRRHVVGRHAGEVALDQRALAADD